MNNTKRSKKLRRNAVISALLALTTVLSIFLSSCKKVEVDIPLVIEADAVCAAEYPEAAPYPNELGPNFEAEYDEWSKTRRIQRSYFGNGTDLDPFFMATVSEFLSDSDGKNAVYSPLNVYMALAMLAETTDSECREEILALLGYSDIETLRTKAHAIWNANYSDDGAVTSILASSLWMNETVEYNGDTLKTLAENYYASSFSGEMGSDEYNKMLQSWMNEQTGGLLEEYISDIKMDPNTVMALVTTIYFQAKWAGLFSSDNNTEETFHTPEGDIVCEFMNKTETYGNYYYCDNFAATNLPLENSGAMWLILPDEGVSANELLGDENALAFMCSKANNINHKTLKVNISIPKFDVKSKTDLKEGLMNLGVKSCFSAESADFSPLVPGDSEIWLDKVEHGARVKIDEEGVTAAAYTAMMMCGAAMPPEDEVDFTLDRPFLFVITGADDLPLFVGIVNTPV